MQVTIITPIAPHHQEQFVRCADSVRKQTVECRHLHMIDTAKRGPGYIRNLLLKQVRTEFVVFLDADDYLEPDFILECLKASQPDKYVYTNWYQNGVESETPDGAFWATAWHLVTCLIHTNMIRLVGGFDENFKAMEDTDLFLKFDSYAYCGVKVTKPLVHYTNDGKRGSTALKEGLIPGIKSELTRRYNVGCCGDNKDTLGIRPPVGAKLSDDILVKALWEGNRRVTGQATGRMYGVGISRPRTIWMTPADAEARPDLYYIIPEPTKVPEPKKVIRQRVKRPRTFADMLCAAGVLELPPEAPLPVAATSINPDYAKLNEIAKRITNVQGNAEPSLNGNCKAVIIQSERTNPARAGSAACTSPPGRQAVAIGDG